MVIGVAVGDAVDHDIMSLIDEHYIKVNDFYSLEKIVADVADRVSFSIGYISESFSHYLQYS